MEELGDLRDAILNDLRSKIELSERISSCLKNGMRKFENKYDVKIQVSFERFQDFLENPIDVILDPSVRGVRFALNRYRLGEISRDQLLERLRRSALMSISNNLKLGFTISNTLALLDAVEPERFYEWRLGRLSETNILELKASFRRLESTLGVRSSLLDRELSLGIGRNPDIFIYDGLVRKGRMILGAICTVANLTDGISQINSYKLRERLRDLYESNPPERLLFITTDSEIPRKLLADLERRGALVLRGVTCGCDIRGKLKEILPRISSEIS